VPDDPRTPDTEARFAAVVEEYGRFLRATIARLCPRNLGVQPDDLEQEARVRLWKALKSERPIQDLASYIYRVAASATVDAIRRAKARREEPLEREAADGAPVYLEPATREGQEQALDRRLLLEKVERVLQGMDERRRQVVRLHLQGFTTAEMGTLTGVTEASARNLLHRALRELRERLLVEGITYAGD
jgi:RNA polymerase sigma-70 factor (ECF subfamily)